MMFERKLSLFGSWFYEIGKNKVAENQVLDFWILMCGEKAVKDFVGKCKLDEFDWRIPELKKKA